MFSLEPSDAPIEIETLISEELEENSKFVKENSDKISEYESSLVKRLENFQKPIHKDLYARTIEEITNYIKTIGGNQSFLVNIISFIKLPDLEKFYIDGLLKTKNKDVLQASISRLLNERLRIFNHLELTKTLITTLGVNFNDSVYVGNKDKISNVFRQKFEEILNSEGIKIQDIKIIELAGKKQEKALSTTTNSVKDKIENIVVNPKEEIRKKPAGAKKVGIQRAGRGTSIKADKPTKAEKAPKAIKVAKAAKAEKTAKTPRLSTAEKETKKTLRKAEKELEKDNKRANEKAQLKQRQEERKKRKELIENNKKKIALLKKLQKIHKNRITKVEKKKAEKKEKFEISLANTEFNEFSKEQSKIFFELISDFRFSRRTKKSLIPENLYISFIEKSDEKDFYTLLDLEQTAINRDKLEKNILLSVFKKLISFSKEKLVELDRFKGHKKRIITIKSRLNGLIDEDLENAYINHIKDIETTKIIKAKKIKEEKIIVEDNFFESFGDKITSEQSKIFFEKLADFRTSRRKNAEILSEKTYLAFAEKCSQDDLIKLLDIEQMTLYKNLFTKNILEVFSKRLVKMTIKIGNGVNLLKRVKTIRSKILEKTKLEKLENELETEYINFENRYLEAKKGYKVIDSGNKGFSRSKTIFYHEDEKEKIRIEGTIKYFFDDFIKFRTKSNCIRLFNFIDEEREKPVISACLFDFLRNKDFDIIRDFFMEDDNFWKKSDLYILNFFDIFKDNGFVDDFIKILINNLENLSDDLIENIISEYDGEYIENIENHLNRHALEIERLELEKKAEIEREREELIESIPGRISRLEKTSEINSAKKELIQFFDDLEKIDSEHSDIYEKIAKEKISVILENKMLFTGFIGALNGPYKYLFTKIYLLINIEEISNKYPEFLVIFMQLFLNIGDLEQTLFLQNLCDTKDINYKALEKDLKKVNIIASNKALVEKILNNEILENTDLENLSDTKIILHYIEKLLEKNEIDKVLALLKDKKSIITTGEIANILTRINDMDKLRNFIMTF